MAVKNAGTSLSFSEIENEFGRNSTRSLGNYRVSQTVGSLPNLPLDSGIPQSGEIKFSQFYGKRLNIVVDIYSSNMYGSTKANARARYNANATTVIGGFKTKPGSSSGSKVFINVNTLIGSNKNSRSSVALRTGGWEPGTDLYIDVGPNGYIIGSGGDGGPASNNGGDGSSGLGIEYAGTQIRLGSGAVIAAGWGGGGGGGPSALDPNKSPNDYGGGGGGGGGGRGWPAGGGGNGGSGFGSGNPGRPGNDGSIYGGGAGGNGRTQAGDGGPGNPGGSAGGAGARSGRYGSSPNKGGKKGDNGYSIISAAGTILIPQNNGTIAGDITYGGFS